MIDINQYPWYLRILGFRKLYQVRILDTPIEYKPGEWKYNYKLISYEVRWFGLKLKTITYDSI